MQQQGVRSCTSTLQYSDAMLQATLRRDPILMLKKMTSFTRPGVLGVASDLTIDYTVN